MVIESVHRITPKTNCPINYVFIIYAALPSDKLEGKKFDFNSQTKRYLPKAIITYFKMLWTTQPAVNW